MRIILCGGNGAGKSTLGKILSQKLNCFFMDIENYYFNQNESDYKYETSRTKEEVTNLLLNDMRKHNRFILASVKGNYGKEIESMFTHAIYIHVPKEIRMKRIRNRSFQRFGNRILPNGDLYEKEERFFSMAENRLDDEIDQ